MQWTNKWSEKRLFYVGDVELTAIALLDEPPMGRIVDVIIIEVRGRGINCERVQANLRKEFVGKTVRDWVVAERQR